MADPLYGKTNFIPGFRMFDGAALNRALARVFQGGLSRQDTITAHAGGGQASAVQLTKSLNNVTVCATGGDSVALPKAIAGSLVSVDNNGASSMNVFAKVGSGDTINGTAGTTAFAHANAKRVEYKCVTTGKWLTSTAAIP